MSAETSLRRIVELLEAQIPRGESYGMKFTLPSGSPMLTIDFKDGTSYLARPDDTFTTALYIPQYKLFSMHITNYGPGSLQFATNRPIMSSDAEAPIDVMETLPFDFHNMVVERINLLPVNGACTVRIIALV